MTRFEFVAVLLGYVGAFCLGVLLASWIGDTVDELDL